MGGARFDDDDDGFTLVELVVAMGVFSVLMVLVTALVTQAFDAMRTTTSTSSIEGQGQNAILAMSKLLRFADNPVELFPIKSAFAEAAAGTTTFYSFVPDSGLERVPYRATLGPCLSGQSGCVPGEVVSAVSTPVLSSGSLVLDAEGMPTYGPARTRVLMRTSPGHVPSLALTYYDGAGAVLGGCAQGVSPCTSEATTRTLSTIERNSIRSVRVTLTDTDPSNAVQQRVWVVNPT